MAGHLVKRGWQVHTNAKYARFEYAGVRHTVLLYLSSIHLNNAKMAQRDFMLTLPGVDAHKSDVRIPLAPFDQVTANVAAVAAWADGA